jgi:hypothetical protein
MDNDIVKIQWIKIELTPIDAEMFKLFRQYQIDFQTMVQAGVFDFKNGTAYLCRDPNGVLKNISLQIKTFNKSKEIKVL